MHLQNRNRKSLEHRLAWLALVACTLLLLPLQGQPLTMLRAQGTEIVDAGGNPVILKGYGLGGWLVPEGYMLKIPGFGSPTSIRNMIETLIGPQFTDTFYQTYEANYVNEADIAQIAAWGMNSIRLPFHYKVLWDVNQQAFRPEGFALVDTVISWCRRNQLWVILDMHCAPGGQNKDNISDSDGIEARLWTERPNQLLTLKIWKEIARRYANEPVVGGYDLINEPVLPPSVSTMDFRAFYIELADSIRLVDNNHILFIEGNWYATDFTDLTPPFDANMAYSFHKYWNETDVGTIQYLLNMRNQHNVPLWLGETGENSNPWFYEVVQLLEQHNIGWAWWAHKKLDTITSPYSARIPGAYQALLNYWNGQGGPPSATTAFDALMQMADGLKINNCFYRPGVVKALMDPQFGQQGVPYANHAVPGTIDAADYDIGNQGIGYSDREYKNVGGNSWNNGWSYRNDGVDIERCNDVLGAQWNVGWTESAERLVYTVTAQASGSYRIDCRVSSATGGGKFRFLVDGQIASADVTVPNTGGWQTWMTVSAHDVHINAGTQQIILLIGPGDFNINRMEFTLTALGIDDQTTPAQGFWLAPNYPNPFNPETVIRFSIPAREKVRLTVFTTAGEQVASLVDEDLPAGIHSVTWRPESLASGLYYYRLQTAGRETTRKLMFLK